MSPNQITTVLSVLCAIMPGIRAENAEICTTHSGQSGTCVIAWQCGEARRMIKAKQHPKICRFIGIDPVVCCELEPNIKSRFIEFETKASKKCLEYSLTIEGRIATVDTVDPDHRLDETLVPFVVGGKNAIYLEFSHMALLGYGNETHITWKCGGSLISEKFVLTAAHCIVKDNQTVAFVNLGLHEIFQNKTRGLRYAVKNVIRHPDYKPHRYYNDIALIELDKEVNILSGLKPACLHTTGNITNDILVATGWGAVTEGGQLNDVLQKVNLTSVPFENCTKTYKPSFPLQKGLIEDVHICARGIRSQGDVCQMHYASIGLTKAQSRLMFLEGDYKDSISIPVIDIPKCTGTYERMLSLQSPFRNVMGRFKAPTSFEAWYKRLNGIGDSGGPLQYKFPNSNLYTIIGVTSFGQKCGLVPGVYTKVSYYVPWIEEIVWK